jgi:tetratricopeptide (TPR) repeat protein
MWTPLLLLGMALATPPPGDYRAEVEARVEASLDTLAAAGRAKEAIQLGEDYLREVEPSASVAYAVGLLCNREGKAGAAMHWYNRALAWDPLHAAARYDRGELHLLNGRPAMARADLVVAATLVSDHWVVHFRLAQVAAAMGEPEDLEVHLKDAIRHGFDLDLLAEDRAWRRWIQDPVVGPTLRGLILVYSGDALLERLEGGWRTP